MKTLVAIVLVSLWGLSVGLARAETALEKDPIAKELAQAIVTLERLRLRGAGHSLMKNPHIVELFKREFAEAFRSDPDTPWKLLTELAEKQQALMMGMFENAGVSSAEDLARLEHDHKSISNVCRRATLDFQGASLKAIPACRLGSSQSCASAFVGVLLPFAQALETCGEVGPA